MQVSIKTLVLSALLVSPVLVLAQASQTPMTRAQARYEMVQLQKAGYQPAAEDPYYPADLQAAQARVAASNSQASVGGTQSGTSQTGQ